ncbi:hypothetical protein IY145_20100 [Methylosinus sp. H3A]|uniref:OB-fold nucleic acid binding domain-containing protein n=1 Tax=Methylosinus sp. H3A TaxID=2785786 RepID=UPI0018C1E9EF|nr:hypothetical protein [Methylosinus sp. H3A]
MPRYAELATTNFSFLRGASYPEEMVAQAMALGQIGIGIADRNSLTGVVRAFSYLRVVVMENGAPPPAPLEAGRGRLSPSSVLPVREGARVTVAGLALVRQRPGSASGVIFMTIEDETGGANIVVWPKLFERRRPEVIGARLVAVTGVQNESGVVHVIAQKIEDMSADLRLLEQSRSAKAREAMPKGRSFQ